jgi:hypothetical protein
MTVEFPFRNDLEIKMSPSPFLQKAIVGSAGMAIGAALVTLIQIAAADGAESARLRHLADVASGRTPTPRVVVQRDLHCQNLATGDGAPDPR